MAASDGKRDLIIVSGYYGFGNLGDEAILEELCRELGRLVPAEKVVVLSADPPHTRDTFGVDAAPRADLGRLFRLAARARLLVSGGGGLFQDTRSPGSTIFYASHIAVARLAGCPALIYAQGVGPLSSSLSRLVTQKAFALAGAITVRDQRSAELVQSWGLPAERTADPVWCLPPSPLPQAVEAALPAGAGAREGAPLVGLSLRPAASFTDAHRAAMEQALLAGLPGETRLVLLPLQGSLDRPLLARVRDCWQAAGRVAVMIDPNALSMPSQWITLLSRLDLLVSMRLHAAIMALRSAVPCLGLAYDPKVTRLLTEFEQPILNLTKEPGADSWVNDLKAAFSARHELSRKASAGTEAARNLACQNFNIISRMLGMQRDV